MAFTHNWSGWGVGFDTGKNDYHGLESQNKMTCTDSWCSWATLAKKNPKNSDVKRQFVSGAVYLQKMCLNAFFCILIFFAWFESAGCWAGIFVGWQLFQIRFTKRREHVLVAFFRNYSLKRRFGLDRGQINCWPIFFCFVTYWFFFLILWYRFCFKKCQSCFHHPTDLTKTFNETIDHSINLSLHHSIHPTRNTSAQHVQSINHPADQSIQPSTDQSVQSTNPSTNHAFNNHPITTSILRPRGVQQRFGEVGMIQRRTQKINRQRFHGFLRSENECKIARVEDTEKTLWVHVGPLSLLGKVRFKGIWPFWWSNILTALNTMICCPGKTKFFQDTECQLTGSSWIPMVVSEVGFFYVASLVLVKR